MRDVLDHPLSTKWMEKILKGENMTFEDLVPYSRVSLRRKRMRKKFLKNPMRYLSERTHQAWIGCVVGKFSANVFKKQLDFNLDIEPINNDTENFRPDGKLHYLDYQYKK